jgi:hypothetical protein
MEPAIDAIAPELLAFAADMRSLVVTAWDEHMNITVRRAQTKRILLQFPSFNPITLLPPYVSKYSVYIIIVKFF